MNRFQIILLVLLSVPLCNISNAQESNVLADKYSVTIPDNYQNQGKSYSLIVHYKDKAIESLLQQYANTNQTIILQLNDSAVSTWVPDTLKVIIQQTIHDFSIARDKIYLLGMNENIEKTVEMCKSLNYYFAATTYITSNERTFNFFKDRLKLNDSVKLYFFDAIDLNVLGTIHQHFLDNYLWAIDVKKVSEDAIRFNFDKSNDKENKNQLSLSYGQWCFDNAVKSNNNTLLEIPNNMGFWNLSFARYLTKSLTVKCKVGIITKKIEPPRPDFFSVINGVNVNIEGGGILLMPISVGMDSYFLKKRFRPFAGFSVGIVPTMYKYVEAKGNISYGIIRNEIEFNSNAPFVEISTGFIYRTGKNIQMGLNADYNQSKEFNENIGGYRAFSGFKISMLFSVMF